MSIHPLIELKALTSSCKFELRELDERHGNLHLPAKTAVYRALYENNEVALLTLDERIDLDLLVIYDLYVETTCRGREYGKLILLEIEKMALEKKLSAVRLSPVPTDNFLTKDELVNWYKKQGYTESYAGELEKKVLV